MRTFSERLRFRYGVFHRFSNALALVLLGAVPAFAEPVVVAAMGDSLTHGYGLSSDDGFVPQMQGWLDEQNVEVRLINAGVSGDTTAGGLSRAAWTLTPDVDAMILALGANDYLRGIAPEVVRENLEGILSTAQAQGVEVLLIGLDVGSNYGPDYTAAFDAIYPDLAQDYGAAYFPSWFTGLENAAGQVRPTAEFFQNDGIHPNAAGVGRIVGAMGPAVLDFLATVD